MKFTTVAIAVLPALAAAGPLEDTFNLVKRAACATSNVLAGLSAIEASVSKLSSDFAALPTTTAPCPSVSLPVFLSDASSLISRISLEASSISACAPGVTACNNVVAEINTGLIPKVLALSSVIVNHKGVVQCNTLGNVLKLEASSISSAVVAYSAAVQTKVPAGTCSQTVSPLVSTITSAIQGIITQF